VTAALALESENGWQMRPLGELLAVQNGFAFSSKKFSETDGVPLIRIRDLKNDGASAVKFDGEYDPSYLVDDGDLLIGMDGEFVCYEWAGGPALLNQRVCRLTEFSADLEPRFVLYGINKFLREIEDATTFTTVKHLSSKKIKAIEFPLPPLEEQKRIVAVLDQAFAALDRARANAEANLADAEELLVNYHANILEREAHGAQVVPLESLLKAGRKIGYGVLKPGKHDPTGKRLIKSQQVRDGWMDLSEDFRITEELDSQYARTRLMGGEILLNLVGASIGRSAVAPQEIAGANVSRAVAVIPVEEELTNWVQYNLRGPAGQGLIQSKTGGSAQPVLNLSEVKALPIPLPPHDSRQSIIRSLDVVSAKAKVLADSFRQSVEELGALKQSILQKAFAGELT
jgi:type I restriction enzyme S subunit